MGIGSKTTSGNKGQGKPITKGLLYRVLGFFTKQNIKHRMLQHGTMLKQTISIYHTKPVLHHVFSLKPLFATPIKKQKNNAKNMLSRTLNV